MNLMKRTMSLILVLAMVFSLPANALAATPQSEKSDLLASWDFEELKTGADGSQYFEDKSGNGHDAVVTLGEAVQTDRDGSKAVAFAKGSNTLLTAKNTDGADSEFSFGKDDSFTLAGWIKVYDGSNYWQAAIQRGRDIRQGNGYIYYGLWLAGDGRYNYSSNLFGSTAVKEQWQHFAIVQNGKDGIRQFWLNGKLTAFGAAATGASSGAFTMGGVPNLNEYFHGELDEVALYKTALQEKEIADLAGVAPQERVGLVAKWSFEDISNGVVTDVTGHGHDGVISGAPTLEEGVTGQAMVFTGKQKVLVDNDPAFSTESYTFSCWIKTTGNGTYQAIFQKGRETTPWSGLWISTGNRLFMGSSQASGEITGPAPTGQWEHVALVQDMETGTRSMYINGLLVEQMSGTNIFTNVDKLTIGGRNSTGQPESFIGSIDEACFYDKALTQAEIIEEAGLGLHTVQLVVPAGATVEVRNMEGNVLVSADESGSYQVTTGNYTIHVAKKTGAEKSFQEYIDADKTLNLSEGFLDYPVNMNLAEGAEILILGEEHRMYPDVDGTYLLPSGDYDYIVSKAGYQQIRGSFTVADQEITLALPEMKQNPADGTRAISQADVEDRIKGGWIGEIAGVTWGAPTEFRWRQRMLKDIDVPDWTTIDVNDVFNQDDLFVEIPFLKTFDEYGLTANWTQLGNAFRDSTFWLAHANAHARANLRNGIEAPWSGHYSYNGHCDDIDWQIECDSIAMMAFGQPTVAAELAWRLGHVMNYGDGVYGGVFVSTLYAAAGTAETFDQIIEAGLNAIPVGTKFRTMMEKVKNFYDNNPDSTWRDCWQMLEDDPVTHQDRCVAIEGPDYNIDAKLNSAYILIGLLYGDQDFEETMRISMCCGQDSDCNPSSAGGILGSYLGASLIPEKWTDGLNWDNTFNGFPEYSLTDLIDMNVGLAQECLDLTGGKIEDGTWTIPANESKALILEQWPEQTNVAPSVSANVDPDPADPTGRTYIFSASATDSDGQVMDYQWFFGDLQYESGAKQTHTYPKDGTYYAICYATDDVGNTGWKQVEINIGVNLKLNKSTLRLKTGAKSVLALSGLPEGAVATWTSSNPEVATVDANGVVTAVKTGKANITAKYNESSATCTVTVVDAGTLVAKYDFETLGSTVEDVTGKNHTGTVHGTPTQIDRAGGKAISFTGREYITVARQDDFTSQSGDYTFAAWVKSTANSTYQTVFQIGRESSNHAGLWVFGRQYVFGSAAGNLGGSIASGDWQYVVIVQDWDLGTQTIYVDGVAVAQGPAATAPTQDAMTIGARSNGSEGFGGGVDDAAYYTRVMTLDEICKELGKTTYTVTIEKPVDLTVTVKNSNGYLMSAKEENVYPLVPGVYTISATNINGNTYEETITVEDTDLTVNLNGLVEQKLSFNLAEGAEVLLLNSGKRIAPAKDGLYYVFPSNYSYIITKEGFEPIRSTVKVDKDSGAVTVDASEMTASDPSGVRVVAEKDVEDRIKGGWIGEMAGVSWSASTEFRWQGTMGPDSGVPTWTPNTINGTLYQDDLYVEIPFLQAYEQYGLNASWEVLGNTFRDTTYRLWHANLIGRNNLKAGIPAPDSGHYSNNEHCDDIDWQIEADSTGMIAFGQPALAQEMTWRAGHVMNYGDGVYGGVFVGTMYATAGTAETFDQVIEAGINAIPTGTKFRTMMDFVKGYYDNNPGSTWRDCWRALEAQDMAHDDRCPEGKDRVFNIDARLNSAYILIGLLYGEQDFEETMRISMLCGQDSDCNPSSAAGILGSYLGLSNINTKWYEALRWDDSFEGYDGYSPNKCIETNIALAKEGLLMTGGSITDDGDWVIPYNPSKPLIREQWPEKANAAPELTASVELDPADPTGRTYLFTASATDSDGEVQDYQWFFGDLLFASGAEQTHQYLNDGTYYAVCYTTDDVGNTSWKQIEIVVEGVDELAIVNQPEAFAGQIGETATFHVDVTRKDVTYQWMYSNNGGKSFVNSTMAGANTDTLTVAMKAFRIGQIYKCVITDTQGNVVETKEVAMTTATTLAIVTQPVDYTGEIGDTAVFTVEAQGEGLTYQWMYSNNQGRSWSKSTLPGYNTAEVSVELKAFRAGQLYKCVVTDVSGNVQESTAAAMSVSD